MDTTVPAHTIFVIHPFSTDDLERYMLANPAKINAKPVEKELGSYFTDAANESRKMKIMPNSFWISLKFKYFHKKEELDEKELKRQAKIVASRAVSYSAGLIKLFYKEIGL